MQERKIIAGERGIYRDLQNTKTLTKNGYGVTVAVRHTGGRYPDELSEDELIYHYPKTKNKSHDIGEIFGTKECMNLNLPIFVILEGESKSTKNIKLGWVQDFDDNEKIFLIEFSQKKPIYKHIEEQTPFSLTDYTKRGKSTVKTRPKQTIFRFFITKNYGYKCGVCSIKIPELLQAIHIRDKKFNGSDDWRNGMFLCLNHHKAFDEYLFKIDPDDLSIKSKSDDLKIEESYLKTKSGKTPHEEALKWRWKREGKVV